MACSKCQWHFPSKASQTTMRHAPHILPGSKRERVGSCRCTNLPLSTVPFEPCCLELSWEANRSTFAIKMMLISEDPAAGQSSALLSAVALTACHSPLMSTVWVLSYCQRLFVCVCVCVFVCVCVCLCEKIDKHSSFPHGVIGRTVLQD